MEHMGYLAKRVFINKDLNNDHFIDICFTHKNERQVWYCRKDEHRMMYGICLNEKMQERFFNEIGADFEDANFEEKLQLFFEDCPIDDYYKMMHTFFEGFNEIGIVPHSIKFDRESDTHVLMTDQYNVFSCISDNFLERYLFGLIMNSVEEFQTNNATKIKISVHGNKYEIIDDGIGIAVEDSEEFKDYEWKRILLFPHIVFEYPEIFSKEPEKVLITDYFNSKYSKSGSYKQTPKYYYKSSSPKATEHPGQTLAHAKSYAKSMEILTVRNGKEYSFKFENGYCTSGRVINEITNFERGTHIKWIPDDCCFENTSISFDSIAAFLEQQAFLNAGLHITLDYEGKEHTFTCPSGLEEYISSKIKEPLLPTRKRKVTITTQYSESLSNQEELELCLIIGENGFLAAYHNYCKMEYGSTLDDVYKEIADWFNNFLKHSLLSMKYEEYKKVEFTIDEIKKHFGIIISSYSEYSSYFNAAYKGLSNSYFKLAVKESITSILTSYFGGVAQKEKINDAKKVVDAILGSGK